MNDKLDEVMENADITKKIDEMEKLISSKEADMTSLYDEADDLKREIMDLEDALEILYKARGNKHGE